MKRSKWTKILVAAGCCALATGVGVMSLNSTAKAEDVIFQDVNVNSFTVLEGAQVRLVSGSKAGTGIRFISQMDSEAYNALEAKESAGSAAVNYGMLIVPADYLNATGKGAVTKESVFGENAVYCVEKADHDTNCAKTHIASVESETMVVEGTTAIFRGSLVDIKESNIHREFVGVAYIKYTAAEDVAEYQFATADNACSMTYLAQKAVKEGKDDDYGTLNATYIQPLVDKGTQVKYTVEHYLPTGTDGEYELAESEELWGDLNASVSASNIAKVNNSFGEWATARSNAIEEANVSDIVYINGETTLKCYYEKVDTTLWSSQDTEDVTYMSKANADAGTYSRVVEKSSQGLADDPASELDHKVMKITSVDMNRDRDGVLDIGLDAKKVEDANAANWDYLTFRMYITAEACISGRYSSITEETIDPESDSYNEAAAKAYAKEAELINSITEVGVSNGNMSLGMYPVNEWVDVVVPKAVLNSGGGWNGSKWEIYSFFIDNQATDPVMTKTAFDQKFTEFVVGGKNFFNIFTYKSKTTSLLKGMDETYPTMTNVHDIAVSYYIDTITWGVDYTAPTLEVNSDPLYTKAFFDDENDDTATFVPSYTVTDDVLFAPTNSRVGSYIKSETIINKYDLDGKLIQVLKANEDGAFEISRDENAVYKFQVAAWDWSVADVPGNRTTSEEYEISFGYMGAVDFSFESDLVNVSTALSEKHVETHLADLTDRYGTKKEGVMKLETSMQYETNSSGAAIVLNFSPAQAEKILADYYAALADDTVDFELTITMLFEVGEIGNYKDKITSTGGGNWDNSTKTFGSGWGMVFYAGAKGSDGCTYFGGTPLVGAGSKNANWGTAEKMWDGVWYDVVFTEYILSTHCGWTNDESGKAQARKELTGQDNFIWTGNNYYVDNGSGDNEKLPVKYGTDVTYFIDEISYGTKDTTAEATE